MAADWITFIGRFHPLWVHLPINFLVLAVLLRAYWDWKKSDSFLEAVLPSAGILGNLKKMEYRRNIHLEIQPNEL